MGEMAKRERVVRMSVEQPLWRALTAYRVLTMIYAVLIFVFGRDRYERPWVAVAFLAFLCVWTLATLPRWRTRPAAPSASSSPTSPSPSPASC